MSRIWNIIFSKEVSISLGGQMEIGRRVNLFKSFFYKGLFALEQQPPDRREEAVEIFLDEVKALFKKNAPLKPTESHPKNPQEKTMWMISDQYYERITETIRSQAERYKFSDDPFWKKFGDDLFWVEPSKGIIM